VTAGGVGIEVPAGLDIVAALAGRSSVDEAPERNRIGQGKVRSAKLTKQDGARSEVRRQPQHTLLFHKL
jgi:hypothetical protein